MNARDRLIVALDVPSARDALDFVRELGDTVGFYKIGLELMMGGGAGELLDTLSKDQQLFVDLKLPNDIPETVERAVRVAASRGVRFLTLSNSVTDTTIAAAVRGRGDKPHPELLYVPVLSSMDRSDFAKASGSDEAAFHNELGRRASDAKRAGVDGFIVSGQEIRLLRERFPGVPLVSPGIRPAGAASDDHKRSCTPAEAVRLGADYIVVGRPIRNAPNRRAAAEAIIAELESV